MDMRASGYWLAVGLGALVCGGCVTGDEDPLASPQSQPGAELAEASNAPTSSPAPSSAEDSPAPWGPAIRLSHEHSVDPSPDLAAARRALSGLARTDPQWVKLQHGIALALMVEAAGSDKPDWQPAINTFMAAAKAPGFNEYDQGDELLFDYAAIALRSGSKQTGQDALLQLIREFPRSRFIPHAYAIFGDYKFDQGQFADARQIYSKLLQWQEPSVVAYGAYRTAWCDLRDDSDDANATRALEMFVMARQSAVKLGGSWGTRLADAALRDTAFAYARVGQPTKAKDFFARLARDTGITPDEPLRLLAEAYEEAGDMQAHAEVCQHVSGGC